MNVFRRSVSLIPLVFLVATSASAQATRTWVSGVGDDVNPCSRTAPCKTFAGAISKTAANGEIDVIDAAAYGAVTITKNMTIDGGGGLTAGILATLSSNGVTINGAGIVVTLRNLDISGATTGDPGVSIVAAAQVNIEHCVINQFVNGVATNLAGGSVKVNIVDSRITNNQNGLLLGNGADVVVSTSALTGNTANAINAAGTARVLISNSNISLNNIGVYASSAPAKIFLSHNDIFFNTNPFNVAGGGIIYTYLDNRIQGSGFGGSVLTPVPNPVP